MGEGREREEGVGEERREEGFGEERMEEEEEGGGRPGRGLRFLANTFGKTNPESLDLLTFSMGEER